MNTQIVKFHETELVAIIDGNGTPWVAVKPIIDAIGLNADSAVERIKNDEILGAAHAIRHVHDTSNRLQNMICLPIEYLHGWLFSIDTKRVKPEIRGKLMVYKQECYTVLFTHFYGASKTLTENEKRRYQIRSRMKALNREINEKMREHKQLQKEIENIEVSNFLQLGLELDGIIELSETDHPLN